MSDPRDRRASATPYREAAPHAPTSIVRYSVGGPVAIAIAALLAVAPFIFGWLSVTQSDDPVTWGRGLAILAAIGAIFLVPFVLVVRHCQGVRVEVDHGAGTLLVRTMRWPLRSRVRTIPLSRVMDTVVESHVESRSDGPEPGYMVFLLVEGEPAVRLVEGAWDPDEERIDETAAAIRALLPPRPPRV